MHRRRTGGAGVLDARRRLEAQLRVGLQHQRGRKILRREAGIEMAEHDLVDVCGGNAGIGQRIGRNLDHEALDGFGVELAEWRVRPSDDAGCHGRSPCFGSARFVTYLCAGFSDFIARAHMAVMPAQLPDLISAGGQSQEPPTATTFGSASQDAALASPMPPVGHTRILGNGPASARSALIPPDCSAGKNLTRSKPAASACISSEAVAIPGANGRSLCGGGFQQIRRRTRADAEFGAEPPRPRQIVGVEDRSDADDGFRHLRDHGPGGIDGHRRTQRDLQHADAAGDQCPRQRHRVLQPLDGQHRNDGGGPEDGRELFLPLFCLAAVMGCPARRNRFECARRHRRARDDRAGMAYHNACQPMPRPCGCDRVRAREARGDIGGRETVAGRRGIDDRRLQRLGLDRIGNAVQTHDARRLRQLQHHLGPRNPRQQVFSAFARIERQQILGRGQHDIGEVRRHPETPRAQGRDRASRGRENWYRTRSGPRLRARDRAPRTDRFRPFSP